MNNIYINIKDVAEAKGLKSTRSLRLELNKNESKYISREIKVNGGTSYEILFSSLEPELQDKLRKNENKTTELVPLNYQPPQFVSDQAKMTANFRLNIIIALIKFRNKYSTKKQADSDFLDLYNSGLYLPKAYKFIGSISLGTLHRWLRKYEKHESAECLQPNYKYSKQGEYNSILNDEMKQILLTLLLHPSKYNYGKAIKLTKEILKKRGYEQLPCDLSFKRYAENFRKNNYAEWVLRREGMKAYHDKVEPYIERDISKIEVGDVIVADGHVLNFQVINPFTGRPTRATLVGFLDWKSTALVGYEIMMTESTQCIASALRNAIINLRGYQNQYDQLYSRVKYLKVLDRLHIKDIKKILIATGQNPELAEIYLMYSDGNTRRLEHLISHSISLAKFNGTDEVDETVIKATSKMLMA